MFDVIRIRWKRQKMLLRYVGLGLWIESKKQGEIRRHKQTYRMRKRNIQRVLKKKSLSYKLALKLKYGLLSRF